MEFQQIDVRISKNGRVRIHVSGVKGKQCLAATEALELALGSQVENREMTSEAVDFSTEQHQAEHQRLWNQ